MTKTTNKIAPAVKCGHEHEGLVCDKPSGHHDEHEGWANYGDEKRREEWHDDAGAPTDPQRKPVVFWTVALASGVQVMGKSHGGDLAIVVMDDDGSRQRYVPEPARAEFPSQWISAMHEGLTFLRSRGPNDGSCLSMRVGSDGMLHSLGETPAADRDPVDVLADFIDDASFSANITTKAAREALTALTNRLDRTTFEPVVLTAYEADVVKRAIGKLREWLSNGAGQGSRVELERLGQSLEPIYALLDAGDPLPPPRALGKLQALHQARLRALAGALDLPLAKWSHVLAAVRKLAASDAWRAKAAEWLRRSDDAEHAAKTAFVIDTEDDDRVHGQLDDVLAALADALAAPDSTSVDAERLEHWRKWSELFDPFPKDPPENDNQRRFRVNAWIEMLDGTRPREGKLAALPDGKVPCPKCSRRLKPHPRTGSLPYHGVEQCKGAERCDGSWMSEEQRLQAKLYDIDEPQSVASWRRLVATATRFGIFDAEAMPAPDLLIAVLDHVDAGATVPSPPVVLDIEGEPTDDEQRSYARDLLVWAAGRASRGLPESEKRRLWWALSWIRDEGTRPREGKLALPLNGSTAPDGGAAKS